MSVIIAFFNPIKYDVNKVTSYVRSSLFIIWNCKNIYFLEPSMSTFTSVSL